MIMLCYDGSADARAAIDEAAKLFPGGEATVATIWEPFVDEMIRSGSIGAGWGLSGPIGDDPAVDDESERAAFATATEGAARATDAGLVAQPRAVSRHGGMAYAILAAANELDASLIVVGTRGLGAAKSFVLGSVSRDVLQHADRAVLVMPPPELAEHRRHALAETHVDGDLGGTET